eukprot:TRINITY_DN57528_c0_g1_i1.p1 TRINITY_DN57528_c0_g1~~TRINITY_DN57528_c0_g1_i1.p1  ORF type:complete len:233 (+),score=38.69 TRINITY_DN57528_c0_g1_i1:75-773(+)
MAADLLGLIESSTATDTQGFSLFSLPPATSAEHWLNKSFDEAPAALPCYPPGLESEELAAGQGIPSLLQKGDDLARVGLPPGLEICDGTLDSGPLSTSTASGGTYKHILEESEDGDSLSQEESVSPIESPSMSSSRERLVCQLASMFATKPPTEWEQAAVEAADPYQDWGLSQGSYAGEAAWDYEGWHYGATSAYQAWHCHGGAQPPKKFCAWCGGERKAHYVYCPHCSQKL